MCMSNIVRRMLMKPEEDEVYDSEVYFDFSKANPLVNRGTFGNTLKFDNNGGTYSVGGGGLTLTRATTAHLRPSVSFADLSSMNVKCATFQYKITGWDNDNTLTDTTFATAGYTPSVQNSLYINSMASTGQVGWGFGSGNRLIALYPADFIGKTLTVSFIYQDSTHYSCRVFLDGTMIDERIRFWSSGVRCDLLPYVGCADSGYTNPGFTIQKMRAYYYDNASYFWTATEAASHLL